MSTDAVTTFFALLAVLALAFVVVTGIVAVWSAVARTPAWAHQVRAAIAPVAVPLAWAVALTCTLGSLYLSEVAKFPPCILCWYQRIAMYPLVVVLGIAAIRRDRTVGWYAVPLAGIGLCISVYHYLVERFPDSVSFSCSADVPCTTVWVWKFHFLSIPGMAGIGFATILTLVLLGVSSAPTSPRGTAGPTLDDTSPTDQLQETS
jgi:disulfide bond formation protein DsbB